MVWNILVVCLGQLPRLCPLLASCPPQAYSQPWCCASTAHREPKHRCVTNTALASNPKHNTIWAAVENATSIPVRPSTTLQYDGVYAKMSCSPQGKTKGFDACGHREALRNSEDAKAGCE